MKMKQILGTRLGSALLKTVLAGITAAALFGAGDAYAKTYYGDDWPENPAVGDILIDYCYLNFDDENSTTTIARGKSATLKFIPGGYVREFVQDEGEEGEVTEPYPVYIEDEETQAKILSDVGTFKWYQVGANGELTEIKGETKSSITVSPVEYSTDYRCVFSCGDLEPAENGASVYTYKVAGVLETNKENQNIIIDNSDTAWEDPTYYEITSPALREYTFTLENNSYYVDVNVHDSEFRYINRFELGGTSSSADYSLKRGKKYYLTFGTYLEDKSSVTVPLSIVISEDNKAEEKSLTEKADAEKEAAKKEVEEAKAAKEKAEAEKKAAEEKAAEAKAAKEKAEKQAEEAEKRAGEADTEYWLRRAAEQEAEKAKQEKTELEEQYAAAVIDLKDVVFENIEVTYDGKKHDMPVVQKLPEGVKVTYSATKAQSKIGTYPVMAAFTVEDSSKRLINADPRTASLTITVKAGAVYTAGSLQYQILDPSVNGNGTVTVVAPKAKSIVKVKVPEKAVIGGVSFDVTEISRRAFLNCKEMKSAEVANSVKIIRKGAFEGCTKLEAVRIGTGVTDFGGRVFFGDKKLSRITVASKKLSVAGKDIFTGSSANLVVRVPKTKVADYTKLLSGKGLSKSAVIKKMPRSK